MKVEYERVSTLGQSTLRQDVLMQEQRIEKIFTEKISGKDCNRPELQKILDFVREGDVVATPTGRFLVSIFATLAQLEREQILIRQQEGVRAQKAAGTYTGGRPRVQINSKLLDTVVSRWRSGEITAVQAMKDLSVKKSTFYRITKK